MDLTGSSIASLVTGDVTGLPMTLQILDIRLLNADIHGTVFARLKLSDGRYYYGGFVINASMLSALHASLYSIIRINQLSALKHSQEKFVLRIIQMELVTQHDKCVGFPEPWYKQTMDVSTYVPINNIQCNVGDSPIFHQSNHMIDVTPIIELSASVSTNAVEAVVTRKSEICIYANGLGKFFTFDIADMHSEIRCKAFNNIVNQFFVLITLGQAYHLENFVLTRSNKQYNHLSHDFEINLTKNTIIHQISGQEFRSIHVTFNFINISDISLADAGKCVDILVSVKSIESADLVYVAKKNSHLHRRIITVLDDTGEINVVLWNDFAKNFSGRINQKIHFKDLLIQEFKAKLQLTTTLMSVINLQNEP